MFSYFGRRTQDMAFAPYKNKLARAAAAAYVSETLAAYLQGREKSYAVQDAINELQALFHRGADIPIRLIKEGLATADEDYRAALFDKAMDLIGRQLRGDD